MTSDSVVNVVDQTPRKGTTGGNSGTPGSNGSTTQNKPHSVTNFNDENYKLIAELVFRRSPDADMVTDIKDFLDLVAIESLIDFEHVNGHELLNSTQTPSASKITGARLVRLRQVIDYFSVPGTSLSDGLTTQTITTTLEQRAKTSKSDSTGAGKPSSHTPVKLQLPEPEPFSGHRRDFWDWIDSVQDAFGRASIPDALTDKDYHLREPELSTAGFFHLSKACKHGSQAHLPEKVKLANNGRTVAYDLYEALMAIFNTPTARNHFLMYAVDCLTSIRLDHTTTIEEFISSWEKLLARLTKQGANGDISPRLIRVFLSRSIISEEYSKVREFITDNDQEEMDVYFAKLRARDEQTDVRDGVPPVNDDGQSLNTVINRRGVSFSDQDSRGKKSDSDSNKYSTHKKVQHPKWHIPPLPRGWKAHIPNGFGKRMDKWRSMAHGTNVSLKILSKEFDANRRFVEPKKNRRGKTETENDEDDGSNKEKPKRKALIVSAHKKLRQVNGKEVYDHEVFCEVDV